MRATIALLAALSLCAFSLIVGGLWLAKQFRTQGPTVDVTSGNTDNQTDSGSEVLMAGESFAVDERITLADGIKDSKNQYAFTVIAKASVKAGGTLKCSGVIISPKLILTAGHCVCVRREEPEAQENVKSIIDGSVCAKDATVTVVTYRPRQESVDSPAGTQSKSYEGKVSLHPEMKVLLDAQSFVVSSHADLAVISLRESADDSVGVVHLADSEVKVGDSIIMAGYGYDATTDLIYGVRRFGRKKVTRVSSEGGDGILFEPEGGFAYTSGSGEPCLRQDAKGQSLVGISGMGMGDEPSCTGIYMYLDWIRSEMQGSMRNDNGGDSGLP